MSITSSQRSPGTYLQLNKVGLLLVALRENRDHKESWGVSIRGYSKEPIDIGFGL